MLTLEECENKSPKPSIYAGDRLLIQGETYEVTGWGANHLGYKIVSIADHKANVERWLSWDAALDAITAYRQVEQRKALTDAMRQDVEALHRTLADKLRQPKPLDIIE